MPGTIDPTKEALNKGFLYTRGKVIGGCSNVNAIAYIRGHKADYDSWTSQDEDFKIIMDSMICFMYKALQLINVKVVKNISIPYNNDFNGVRQNGVGEYQ
ncbi:16693_t:CDS:2, partial [Gigaspora margarita]